MKQGGDTIPMNLGAAAGLSCAACGDDGSPGINFPAVTPDGQPRFPRLCQHCLSSLLGVMFANAGHAHEEISQAVISVQVEGFKVPRPT